MPSGLEYKTVLRMTHTFVNKHKHYATTIQRVPTTKDQNAFTLAYLLMNFASDKILDILKNVLGDLQTCKLFIQVAHFPILEQTFEISKICLQHHHFRNVRHVSTSTTKKGSATNVVSQLTRTVHKLKFVRKPSIFNAENIRK